MIQSLEDFVSMAIQGTQVPMYTKHTLFLYFSDFSIFFYFYFYMKNKTKQNWKIIKQKHVKQKQYNVKKKLTRCKCMRAW